MERASRAGRRSMDRWPGRGRTWPAIPGHRDRCWPTGCWPTS